MKKALHIHVTPDCFKRDVYIGLDYLVGSQLSRLCTIMTIFIVVVTKVKLNNGACAPHNLCNFTTTLIKDEDQSISVETKKFLS